MNFKGLILNCLLLLSLTYLFGETIDKKEGKYSSNKKLNYSFSINLGGIRIDEKYGWDSVRKINYGVGLIINYKNLFTNEFEYRLNKPELINLNAKFPFLNDYKGHGFSIFHGIYKLSYEFFFKNTFGIKLEKEAINEEIYTNLRFMNAPFSIHYLNRKVLFCYMVKIHEYKFLMRTGISKTNHGQVSLQGYFPTGELFVDGYVLNKTGLVIAPEFRLPIANRIQAKAGIEWMIFPSKIPNLFEANVGIIYNMKRIKEKVKS
jgi:hypothetical protein